MADEKITNILRTTNWKDCILTVHALHGTNTKMVFRVSFEPRMNREAVEVEISRMFTIKIGDRTYQKFPPCPKTFPYPEDVTDDILKMNYKYLSDALKNIVGILDRDWREPCVKKLLNKHDA